MKSMKKPKSKAAPLKKALSPLAKSKKKVTFEKVTDTAEELRQCAAEGPRPTFVHP